MLIMLPVLKSIALSLLTNMVANILIDPKWNTLTQLLSLTEFKNQ